MPEQAQTSALADRLKLGAFFGLAALGLSLGVSADIASFTDACQRLKPIDRSELKSTGPTGKWLSREFETSRYCFTLVSTGDTTGFIEIHSKKSSDKDINQDFAKVSLRGRVLEGSHAAAMKGINQLRREKPELFVKK